MFGRNNRLDTEWLASVPFFSDFTPDQLDQVADLGKKVEAEVGAELTDQGRFGDVCYVISSGTANVYIGGEYVATVAGGSMVGEMSLLEHRPRNASVVAESSMQLVSFGMKEFRELLDSNPTASEKVHALLNSRARANAAREENE